MRDNRESSWSLFKMKCRIYASVKIKMCNIETTFSFSFFNCTRIAVWASHSQGRSYNSAQTVHSWRKCWDVGTPAARMLQLLRQSMRLSVPHRVTLPEIQVFVNMHIGLCRAYRANIKLCILYFYSGIVLVTWSFAIVYICREKVTQRNVRYRCNLLHMPKKNTFRYARICSDLLQTVRSIKI